MAQRSLRVDHTSAHFAGIAALIDDARTADVTFVVCEDSSHESTVVLDRTDRDVGAGRGTRTASVVLEADFLTAAVTPAPAAAGGSDTSVLTGNRAARRANSVAGGYASAVRADGALSHAAQPVEIEFVGHRAIFAAASDYFRRTLYTPTAMAGSGRSDMRVQLPTAVTAFAFQAVRQYVYSGQCTIDAQSTVELLAAAAVCELGSLLAAVGDFAVRSLSAAHIWKTLLTADRYAEQHHNKQVHKQGVVHAHCVELREHCLAFLADRAATLISAESWLLLPAHLVAMLTQRDDVKVNELQLFQAVLRWVDADRHGRAKVAADTITPWIRLGTLTVRTIMKVVKPSGIVAESQWLEALDFLAAPTEAAATGEPWLYRPRQGQLQSPEHLRFDPRSTGLTLHNERRCVQSWSSGWHGVAGDRTWGSEGWDEAYARDLDAAVCVLHLQMNSCYNIGNEWEAIVGVTTPGRDIRQGDQAWSGIAGYIIGTGEKTSGGDGDGQPYSAEDVQPPLARDGSVISMTYRPAHGSLEFAIDGESLGLAFTAGLEPPVVPAIAIDARAKFTILTQNEAAEAFTAAEERRRRTPALVDMSPGIRGPGRDGDVLQGPRAERFLGRSELSLHPVPTPIVESGDSRGLGYQ